MADPDTRDVHVDTWLTNLSIAYQQLGYIADLVFPIVPVMKQSNIYPLYDKSAWFRDDAHIRAPGTRSRGGGWTTTRTNYFCDRYSFRKEIDDETRDNADSVFNLEDTAVRFVTEKMQLRREVAFATDFFKTGVWADDNVGGVDFTQWSDYGTSTPLVDFTTFQDEMELRIGREANTLVIGKQVWNQIRWHPDLIDTIKYTERGVVSEELARTLLGVDRLLIGRAMKTTDPEGTAESAVTYTRIWGKNGLLTYTPASASLLEPAAGYTFVWNRVAAALQWIKRMRDEEREVDIIEGNSYFDQKVTSAPAGTFFSGMVA